MTAIITVAEELLAEYQHWRDNLPVSLAETDQAEPLIERSQEETATSS